jgi:UDP-glucose 4-epimerase
LHPPSSTYGASKQAGEGLFASYAAMFDISAIAFRFGNVVGPRQTHGVGYDFVRRLKADPTKLRILGDGSQSKSYIYVTDVVAAVLLAGEKLGGRPGAFDAYNVATGDYITVKEIADLACEVAGAKNTKFEYSGGDRGWKGDVPVVRLNTDRIKSLGWRCSRGSRQALKDSMTAMLGEL